MVFKKIREHKEYIQDAASWFQAKWDIPQEEYLKSMNESLLKETSIPQWYIMLENDNSIIGGIGVIENDFHNRKDLTPNICALYVDEKYRRQGVAGYMLKQVCVFRVIYAKTDIVNQFVSAYTIRSQSSGRNRA